MVAFVEMDTAVTFQDQIKQQDGPVILINRITVSPDEVDQMLAAWTDDAAWIKQQPGYISTQLHRGIAGSGTFLNYAVWESVDHFRSAFGHPDFQRKLSAYPPSTVASPHLFQKFAVSGFCV